ncbi:MAG: biopolymer transporter ExbD [Bacillota bacterium]|jgi:biopolymer transport protein ExbD
MKLLRNTPKKARIDLVPMIDTIFSLLVFFMLVSLAAVPRYSIPVNLPSATGVSEKMRQVETITITKDGKIFINKEEVASSGEAALRLLKQERKDATLAVIINADRSVPHGKVVELLDAIQQCGPAKIAIAINHS